MIEYNIHLLASAKNSQTRLWTFDNRLENQAIELALSYQY